jgi:glutamine synthetase
MPGEAIDFACHKIAAALQKDPRDFTRDDLVKFVLQEEIRRINFRYPAFDGRVKTLGFVVHSRSHLEQILDRGERVDGSSLFESIDSASSDLYVVPRYRTAFLSPFSEVPTVELLCSFFNSDGQPLESAPEYELAKAQKSLRAVGYEMHAMGELEYYAIRDSDPLYPGVPQRGYHESRPFTKFAGLREEAMLAIARAGGRVKYGHSEVGTFHSDGKDLEQHEIEFLPVPVEEAADQLLIAKWMVRMVAYRRGVTVSFAPKVMVGHAGSGLHIHTMLVENGRNAFSDGQGITEVARRVIGGYLDMAPSLTAFGNTVPLSYLRLVPHQEAPTNICWGDRNRSVLVRVPLGWHGVDDIARKANPGANSPSGKVMNPQTVEFRSPDGSADIYGLLSGLTVAARHGLEMKDAKELADRLYVDINMFSSNHAGVQRELPQLPGSCSESAEALLARRTVYEQHGVFMPSRIDAIASRLRDFRDQGTSERLFGHDDDVRAMVRDNLHVS